MQTDLIPLFPRLPVPPLQVPLIGGGLFEIAAERPQAFSLIVFYRGLHCPICQTQLKDLERNLDAFETRGVSVIAISSDIEKRANETKAAWNLPKLRIGYALSLSTARNWGLFVSTGRSKTSAGVDEPAQFSEPALYLVRPDGTLYFGSVQTMPFARPHFAEILTAIDYVIKNDYPARGEVRNLAGAD